MKLFIFALILCLALYVAALLLLWFMVPEPNLLGDTAGALNGLFSALAFAGVIYALLRQSREFRRLADRPERRVTLTILDATESHPELADTHSTPAADRPDFAALRARIETLRAEEQQLLTDLKRQGINLEQILKDEGRTGGDSAHLGPTKS